ncbi:hypothetical protein AJ80_04464 [Polytolypa hystricis UAMH7299]|uniref:Uncharacterized protein n=1 Tax=Polytolypa hystricis (strain UAMH7299) TaxID=1447883 RepID=A0A2B7Y330_POLH7|nr:hypothetical protein AJ80_04464 [Polytolypa hystricis UAMH7299]
MPLTLKSDDRILWLCLGVSLYFAVRGIAAELHRVRGLTEIKNKEKEDHVIGEGTEDALKLETLQKLSESTSFDLRCAALRIISERATKGSTRDLLLEDLASKDTIRRGKALNALYFLLSNRALARSSVSTRLKDLPTYTAVIDCLCNFLDEHTEETSQTLSPILPKTRPLGEKKALSTLNLILAENIPAALEAGVVSRWLVKYPFPCTIHDEASRQNIVTLMKTWWTDDAVMSSIVNTLSSNQEGVKQLRKYGLMGSRMEEHMQIYNDDDDDVLGLQNGDIDHENDFDNVADSDSDAWMGAGGEVRNGTGRRRQEGTAEEQELRRRRREAMVLSEGGRPFWQSNIIPPVNDEVEVDENLEMELEQLEEEVNREDEAERNARAGRRWRLWPFS